MTGSNPAPPKASAGAEDPAPDHREESVLRYALSFQWAHRTSEACLYVSGVAMALATLVMVHGVVMRYFLGRSTIWQTELAIYLLLVVAFFGAAYGAKHHAHVGIDLLVERLRPRRRTQIKLFTDLMSLAVVLVVVFTAGAVWLEALFSGWESHTSWRAPLGAVYAIVPLGMLLVAFQYTAFIVEGVQALRSGRTGDPAAETEIVLPTAVPGVRLDGPDAEPRSGEADPGDASERSAQS